MRYFQQNCQFKGLALVKRDYQSLKSLLEGLCHIDLPRLYQGKLLHITQPRLPLLGPQNQPNVTQTNLLILSPYSKSVAKGHYRLKLSQECLCHVNISCLCLGGLWHTYLT